MATKDLSELVNNMRDEVADEVITRYIPPQSIFEQWDVPGLEAALGAEFAIHLPVSKWLEEDDKLFEESLRQKIKDALSEAYNKKREIIGANMLLLEKQ